jgi:hypothetical protein
MTKITQEEVERLPGVLAEMESWLHFGGDPEDDRPATEVWSELWFCDADYMLVFRAARSVLSEQSRIDAAVARERERCAAAVRAVADEFERQWRDDLKADSYLQGKADGADDAEDAIRALSPTPTTEEGR